MQAGRQIGDATWRARLHATVARFGGETVIEAMWDLRKCFEATQVEDQVLKNRSLEFLHVNN